MSSMPTMSDEQAETAPPPAAPCALCNAEMPAGTAKQVTTYKGRNATTVKVCGGCAANVRRDLAAERPTAGAYPLALVAGALGAVVGAAVWVIIAAATNYEVGYVAVLVGFLAGYGVRLGAGRARGVGLQVASVALTVGALALAKYGIFTYFLAKAARNEGVDIGYFDPRVVAAFGEHFGSTLSPMDALFVLLAIGAAYKVAAPSRVIVEP